MADGYIEFSTKLDNADLEKNLKSAEKSVQSLKNKIESDEDKKTLIEKQMERSEAAIHDTEAEIDRLKSRINELNQLAVDNPFAKNAATAEASKLKLELAEQEKILQKQIKDQDSLNNKWQQVNDAVELNRGKLQSAEAKVQTLGSEVQASASKARAPWAAVTDSIKSKFASAGTFARKTMENAANSAVSPWQNFGKRVNTMLRKVFVFGMVLKGIRAVKSTLSSMLQENEQFNASVANLKAVTDGFLASMVQAVLPVFIQVVNTLAAVFERVAAFIDSIFGTGIVAAIQGQRQNASNAIAAGNAQKQADYDAQVAERNADIAKQQAAIDGQREKNAKAQEKADRRRAKSAEKLAKAQEKANQQILAFDEINALSAESSEAAADAIDDYAEELEVPEIEYPDEIEPPQFDADWTQMGFGDTGMFQGILDWLDMLRDRIANDVEGPFARIREGLGLIKTGWDELVEGIRTGNLGLIWRGIGDMVIGVLYAIEGAIGAFLDWLDEATGGRFHAVFEGLKQAVHGVVEFIEGLLRGDWQLMFQGLRDVVNGVVSAIQGLFDSLFNWLDEATGGRFHPVIEQIKNVVHDAWENIRTILGGAIEFLEGVFTLNLEKAINGLQAIINGSFDFVGTILNGILDRSKFMVTTLFDWLSAKFPKLKPIFETAKTAFSSVINAIKAILNGALNGAKDVIGGSLKAIIGIFTLNGDLILDGIKQMGKGVGKVFRGIAESAISIWSPIADWFNKNVITPIGDFFSNLGDSIKNVFSNAWDGITSGASNAWDGIKNVFSTVADFFKTIFGQAWEGVKQAFSQGGQVFDGVVDAIVNAFKALANNAIDGLNWAIAQPFNGINGIIRALKGWEVFDIKPFAGFWEISVPSIPHLAGGAVIPPNREFMAVLGDQKSGRNLEAPEDLIRQIVREESGGASMQQAITAALMQVLPSLLNDGFGDVTMILQVGNEQLAQAVNKGNASLARRGLIDPVFDF